MEGLAATLVTVVLLVVFYKALTKIAGGVEQLAGAMENGAKGVNVYSEVAVDVGQMYADIQRAQLRNELNRLTKDNI